MNDIMHKFRIGDSIVRIGSNWKNDTEEKVILHEIITKTGTDIIWVDNKHKPEDCLYAAFAFYDTLAANLLLEKTLAQAERHKKESNDLMIETYKLKNAQTRGEDK